VEQRKQLFPWDAQLTAVLKAKEAAAAVDGAVAEKKEEKVSVEESKPVRVFPEVRFFFRVFCGMECVLASVLLAQPLTVFAYLLSVECGCKP